MTGDGPIDLLYSSGFISHVEHAWELPSNVRFYEHLGRFARLIRFDRRGVGLSDRMAGLANLAERVADISAVLDAVGSRHAALFGVHEGGAVSALYAATHPARVSRLVLYGSFARLTATEDYPFGPPPEAIDMQAAYFEATWGQEGATAGGSLRDDIVYRKWLARLQRLACSPREAARMTRSAAEIDVREALARVEAPTLVLHRTHDPFCSVDHGRYLSDHIPGARLIELDGIDHLPFVGDTDAIVREVEEFLTGTRHEAQPERVLATVLFTDIVGSTEGATSMGDRRWRDLLELHHALVRRLLASFRGREVNTVGDGFFATFESPAQAIRCACAVRDGVKSLGLEIRAGIHAGEVEVHGDDMAGIAVHVAARVAALAGASEVLVSRTVGDLVHGSNIELADHGTHALKGVTGDWQLLRVTRA